MTFQKLTFEEDTQSDNSENSNDNQNQQSSHQPSQPSSPSQQQSSQQSSSKPIIIETYTPKPGSLDYKTVYEASMRELVDCQTFVEQYTRQDQLAFLDEFKYDLFYFIKQPIEVQHYVLMMVIAGQRLTNQISLPYLLRDKDLLKDLIKEATYVFENFTPENIKELFAKQLKWIIDQIDIVRQLNPVSMLYLQCMQYDFPPIYLTRLIIRLVELIVLHSCDFENLIAKLTDLKNNFNLEFKQETPYRQPLPFVVWQQNAQLIEYIGKRKFVYEPPLCQFAVNEAFINQILSVDEHLLTTNADYFKLIQAYFQSNGHMYMQKISVDKEDSVQKDSIQEKSVQEKSIQEDVSEEDGAQEDDIQNDSMQEKNIQDESVQERYIQDKSIQNEHSTLNNTTLNTSISQNTSLNETITQNTASLNACIVCYEELPTNAFVKFDVCPHNNVCKKCFVDIIRSQQTPIFCCPTCKKEVVKIEIQCQDEVMKFRI